MTIFSIAKIPATHKRVKTFLAQSLSANRLAKEKIKIYSKFGGVKMIRSFSALPRGVVLRLSNRSVQVVC